MYFFEQLKLVESKWVAFCHNVEVADEEVMLVLDGMSNPILLQIFVRSNGCGPIQICRICLDLWMVEQRVAFSFQFQGVTLSLKFTLSRILYLLTGGKPI